MINNLKILQSLRIDGIIANLGIKKIKIFNNLSAIAVAAAMTASISTGLINHVSDVLKKQEMIKIVDGINDTVLTDYLMQTGKYSYNDTFGLTNIDLNVYAEIRDTPISKIRFYILGSSNDSYKSNKIIIQREVIDKEKSGISVVSQKLLEQSLETDKDGNYYFSDLNKNSFLRFLTVTFPFLEKDAIKKIFDSISQKKLVAINANFDKTLSDETTSIYEQLTRIQQYFGISDTDLGYTVDNKEDKKTYNATKKYRDLEKYQQLLSNYLWKKAIKNNPNINNIEMMKIDHAKIENEALGFK